MKNLKYFIYSILSLSVIYSCTDLEVEEYDSIVSESSSSGEFTGVTDATASLTDAYNELKGWGDQGGFYALTQVTTDETLIPTRGTDWGDNGVFRTLHQHSWDPTHQWVVSTWNDTNRRIFKLDQLIHPASNASADVLAQAKFLRAFQMTQVVDMYGQVPRRDVNSGPSDNPTVLDSAGALSLIMEDIDAAIAGLPALATGQETSDDIKDGTNMITKTAAQFLKARVLLNKHVWLGESAAAADMTAVIDLVDDINSQGFDIHEDYFDIFAQSADSETIFSSPMGNGNRFWNGLHYYQVTKGNGGGGWNGFSTMAELYDLFEGNAENAYDPLDTERDERRGFVPTIKGDGNPLETDADAIAEEATGIGIGFLQGQQYDNDGEKLEQRNGNPLIFTKTLPGLTGNNEATGIRVVKYHPKNGSYYNGQILFRYSDAHLMKAEAILRGGTSSETALDLVNELRGKRNASTMTAVTLDNILDERARELYTEMVRRTDMIRFGAFTENWSYKGGTSDATRNKFPIPSVALGSNPNLTQNPGY